MKRKIYNGTITVERDGRHGYHVSTTEAMPDGVTTILGLVPKYLLPWVARTNHDDMLKRYVERMDSGEPVDMAWFKSALQEAKGAYLKVRDAAGDIGSTVHDFAESALKGDPRPLPPEDAPEYAGCVAFLDWFNRTQIDLNTVESERMVFSDRLFYAGTCDVFAEINGRPTVIDFKTGSGFYEDQPLQLAAYAMALEEEFGITISDGWIIHLDKKTGKMTPYYVEITDQLKTDWEAVRVAWRAVKRNKDRHKEIKSKAA